MASVRKASTCKYVVSLCCRSLSVVYPPTGLSTTSIHANSSNSAIYICEPPPLCYRDEQVIVDYLVGRALGANPTLPSDTALAALQEAKKNPAKYKLAEVLASLVLNPDQANSWNAVRSLRSIAATVVSAPQQ